MYFENFSELLLMSGHGVFVWSSYAIVFIGLSALVIYPLIKKQKTLKAIKQRSLFEQRKNSL